MLGRIGRPGWFLFKCVMPILILVALGGGLLYVRLLNGPISLQFLAAPIGRSIAGEMPGVNVVIGDALVRLTETGSVEFRLRNVRFSDSDGAPIAVAPLAAVGMSRQALMSGRLAPDKVVLIEPRLLLSYSEGNGLSVSFAPTGKAAVPAPAAEAPAAGADGRPGEPEPATAVERLDIARLIAEAGQRARRGTDAASFLRQVGVRNATVILDHSGLQTVWTVIEADVDLEHKKKRSTVTGQASLASASGPWSTTFKIEEAEKTNSIAIEATIRDLVPKGLAGIAPQLAFLDAAAVPVSGAAKIDLGLDGSVLGGGMQLDIGRGEFRMPGLDQRPLAFEAGKIDLRFDAERRRVVIEPSTLQWDQGQATIAGSVTGVDGADGKRSWTIDLATRDGVLQGEEFRVPAVVLDEATVQASYATATGVLSIGKARIAAGGAAVDAQGEITLDRDGATVRAEGRISPAKAEIAKAIWPRLLAPGARRWVGRNLTRGRISSGTFKVDITARGGEIVPEQRKISMAMEAADFAFVPGKGLAPVEAPRALLRVEGDGLEISIPDASSPIGTAGRRVGLKAGRLTAVALYDEPTLGEIAFRVVSPLPAVVEYLEQDGLEIGPLGLPSEGLDGKVDGQMKINLPLVQGVQASDMKIEGKFKVSDGRAKAALGPHDVQGASIAIDIGDGAVNAAGQMLIGGVAAKLSFQRFLGAPDERQPPLRLSAHLDAADRNQLGFDINQFVSGDVPVDAYITRGAKGEQQVRVRADLSGAELTIEPLAWRKTPGRQALLEFEVVRGGPQQKNRSELQGFKVVGDDIAIDGSMVVDGKGRLTEFNFPNFALTLVSRLEMHGTLRADNIWDVKARGAYWDGREFFRQLFSIGQGQEKAPPPRKDQPGVDLKAEIDTVQGHGDIALKGLNLQMSRRGQRLAGLIARGVVEGGKPIEVGLQHTANEPRKLVVLTDDAGQAFRMVGFYPNLQGGQMRLDVNLDGKGAAEKTGLLDIRSFRILGDAVVSEVLQTPDEARSAAEAGRRPTVRKVERQAIDFQLMQAPFSVGYDQLVLEDAQLRGPLLGASLRGKADFKTQYVDIGGSYIPLQGLNAALGELPAFGQLIAGPKGEGVLGITFRIAGPMAQPQVMVNPLSLMLPGAFRGLGEMAPASYRIVPRGLKPAEPAKVKLPQAPGGGDAVRQPPAKGSRAVQPELSGGWSTSTGGSKN